MTFNIPVKYRKYLSQAQRLPGTGPTMSEEQLKQHIAEVDARTQLRLYEAMTQKPKPVHINCDDFDPFSW
jgi:hypothetical protein